VTPVYSWLAAADEVEHWFERIASADKVEWNALCGALGSSRPEDWQRDPVGRKVCRRCVARLTRSV
jgi:hypothetical protein